MTGNLQPLDQWMRIVKDDGTPTTDFIRWAQNRQIDITNGIDAATAEQLAEALIDAFAAARDINAGTGLTGGGNLSADRTISLANTAVTPGSYTNADITVDAQGRLTAAANGSGGGGGKYFSGYSGETAGSISTNAYATKGIYFRPFEDMSIEAITIPIDAGATTEQYDVEIWSLSSTTLGSNDSQVTNSTTSTKLGTSATVTAKTTNNWPYRLAFTTPVSLTANTIYLFAFVYRNAALGTDILRATSIGIGSLNFGAFNCPGEVFQSYPMYATIGLSASQSPGVTFGNWPVCWPEGTF